MREFSIAKYKAQLQITRDSTENMQKLGVVAEFFFAKSAGKCFTPVIEIKPLKLLRRHTANQRKVLATTMDAYKVQRATHVAE